MESPARCRGSGTCRGRLCLADAGMRMSRSRFDGEVQVQGSALSLELDPEARAWRGQKQTRPLQTLTADGQ